MKNSGLKLKTKHVNMLREARQWIKLILELVGVNKEE